MKKLLYIIFFLFTIHPSFAQEEQPGADRLREKMVEYIQTKLGLNKSEAERFQPLFMDYLNEYKQVSQKHKNDRLLLQKKVAEIRLKFRDQVKPLIGEKRSNDVFTHEGAFIKEVEIERQQRLKERSGGRANKRNNPNL